ncbi:MAG: hypothetical protein V1701_02285 [Planctomycetota bacterium]
MRLFGPAQGLGGFGDIAFVVGELAQELQLPAGRAFQPVADIQEGADELLKCQAGRQVGQGAAITL